MTLSAVIAAMGLPLATRLDQRVPKTLLLENGAPTAADRRQLQAGIEELTWVAALKPNTIAVPAFEDEVRQYLEIAVIALTLRPAAKPARLIELVHRAIPYPVALWTIQAGFVELSLAHKRRSQAVTKYLYGPSTDLLVWLRDTSVIENGRVVKLQKTGTLWDDLAWTGIAKEGGVEFSNGKKPVAFVRRMLSMCLTDDAEGVVVDFFAGSGTTGQALWEVNAVDNGRRRVLLVQLPEPLDATNKDQRAAADFCDKLKKPRTIAELTKERLRRAAKKVKSESPMFAGDTGFRVFKLDSTNINAWEPDREDIEKSVQESLEHLKTGRTEQDILFEVLLKLGLDLCVPIETKVISGKEVHSVGGGVLIVCLSPAIAAAEVEPLGIGIADWRDELAPGAATSCVFRDSAFADDIAKTNLTAILEQHGIARDNIRSL